LHEGATPADNEKEKGKRVRMGEERERGKEGFRLPQLRVLLSPDRMQIFIRAFFFWDSL